jgi:gamma-glutamylcyclotransferase
VSPAHSFKTFLSSPSFSDFKKNERGEFFHYVRNAILHNGETRKDWKIRIDTPRMLERDSTTKTRTINRRLFHAAVIREFRQLNAKLRTGDPTSRQQFLRRMDAIAGLPIDTMGNLYFAYGSNLLEAECHKTAPDAQPYASAFLPGYRLAFTKHSTTRGGDAATILPDENSMVWGFVYRVHDKDREHLRAREGGYEELPKTTVYLVAPTPGDDPTPITAFTFAATHICPKQCGPPSAYLDRIIEGATARQLPTAYQKRLTDLRQQPDQTTDDA